MSGWFAFLSVERAGKKLASIIDSVKAIFEGPAPSSSCSSSQLDDLEELMKLQKTMEYIKAYLRDADNWNIREETTKLKLKDLKDLAYDMEDVVDEYEYEVNRRKVEALNLERCAGVDSTNKRKRHEENEACLEDIGAVAVPKELVHRARKITDRFIHIKDLSNFLALSDNDGERRISHDIADLRQTSSLVVEKSIIGRNQDRDRIVEKILSGEGKNVGSPVSVMAIVGMGGLGKTTVTQLVYNSPRVRQSFDKYAWICVSEPFSVSTITRNIIKSLTDGTCEYTELDDVQRKLADEIKEKKVLLVLDDVWNERSHYWNSLCRPMFVARVCQIIVTTRSEAVARLVQTMDTYHMNCLNPDDSWSLFEQAAFSVDTPKRLKDIGMKICEKCQGLPLAIKTVGSMLRYETDENTWEHVLENEFFELEPTRNEVLPVLELCYKHMPIYLRPCFVALSLYPKDQAMSEGKIIHLWKLLDLLNCSGSYDEDETGSFYLREFVHRSILQPNVFGFYQIHDLVHDLACFLSDGEFYRLEDDTSVESLQKSVESLQKVRYISVPTNDYMSLPILPNSLRAFIMFASHYDRIGNPESLFLSCKNLRALDLKQRSFDKALAGSICSLKLIRHLVLDGVPEFARHVHWCAPPHHPVARDIGHLINLRTLRIAVSECDCCSYNIRELRNINKIRDLTVSGLYGVSCIEHANEAQMQSKKQLRSLSLDFKCSCACYRTMLLHGPSVLSHCKLLESLQPHRSLSRLTIRNYWSHEYPSWLGNDVFSKITRIELNNCKSTHLPPLGRLASLKCLRISCMEYIGLEFIGYLSKSEDFPSLANMKPEYMDNEWSVVDDSDFVQMDTLSIYEFPGLKSLPSLPSVVNVNLTFCHGIAAIPAWSTLRKLSIIHCNSLREVPTLPSLFDLCLDGCPNLKAVNSQPSLTSMSLRHIKASLVGFGSLSSLNSLELYNDKQLFETIPKYEWYSLFYNLPSLKSLEISSDGATCICLKQQSLPSLTRLKLEACRFLQYCDGLAGLTSLQHLEVRRCPMFPTNNLHLLQLKTLIIDDK